MTIQDTPPVRRTASHRAVAATAWKPELPAVDVGDGIVMSPGTTNSYLVTTADGDVVINTGTPYQGERTRERYEQFLGRPLDVRVIVFTQSHPDHMGGWGAFAGPGVETIAHVKYHDGRHDRVLLHEFFRPRRAAVLSQLNPSAQHHASWKAPAAEAEVTTTFHDSHSFEVGGRRFELFSIPGGETLDSLAVWLPASRTVFTGNHGGALYGQFPNFYTLRGDRCRSAHQWIRDADRVLALEPEVLITGHGLPTRGAEQVRHDLGKVRDAIDYVYTETIKGMNAGVGLWTLMQTVQLPEHLQPLPGRGPISWYVREIWEEYAGWFRHETSTELYAIPPRAVWGELVELAGGVEPLVQRAAAHEAAGRHVEALHLLDIVFDSDPGNVEGRRIEITALGALADAADGFDEIGWLETKIDEARALIDAAPDSGA